MQLPKQKKERVKKIDGKAHACIFGFTLDPRISKCYFCNKIKINRT